MSVGIVVDQDLVWAKGYGRVDMDGSGLPDDDTVARVASITKTLTTAAILQLRDEQLLDLDDPLADHLPEFAAVRPVAGPVAAVTLRRVLTHRSGLAAESPVPSWSAPEFPTLEKILAALPKTEIAIPPDSAWKYSNLAFGLLGEVIARLSGRPYVDYIRSEILDPLGMSSSVFELTEDQRGRFFSGYDAEVPGYPETLPLRRARYTHLNGVMACGQLHSTVHDLAKWISFQFREDGGARGGPQVLSGSTLAEMHHPQYIEPDWSSGQCLGWRVSRIGDHVYHGHGGGIHGFASQVSFNLPAKTGVIVLANAWPLTTVEPLAQELIEIAVGAEPASTITTPRSTPTSERAVEAAPVELQPYLGRYFAEPGMPIVIDFQAGVLHISLPSPDAYSIHAPATLEPTGESGELIVRSGRGAGERARFQSGNDGDVTGFALGGWWYQKEAMG